MTTFDTMGFRNALGQFATGVTIITALDENLQPVGVTASSFNSTSLEPPLIMWALGNDRPTMPAFMQASHFGVHVLGQDQRNLSDTFGRSSKEKFSEVGVDLSAHGTPIIPDTIARFECETIHRYEGGDHTIFVGKVVEFHTEDRPPLLFHRGAYAAVGDLVECH